MGILRDAIDDDGHDPFGSPVQAPAAPVPDPLVPDLSPAGTTAPPAAPAGPQPVPASLGPASPGAASPPARSTPPADGRSELRRRRDALAEQVTELHWDLGGLAYEMAIRDHFRLDVLVRRAAVLQERDAELAEVERLLRMEDEAVAGNCPTCAAPHSRGAIYCWQCGATLMERRPSSAVAGGEEATAEMDALLYATPDRPSEDVGPADGGDR